MFREPAGPRPRATRPGGGGAPPGGGAPASVLAACLTLLACLPATGCERTGDDATVPAWSGEAPVLPALERDLADATAAARAAGDSVIEALRPVPLMTPGDEAALRRYNNAAHLTRARALGARPANEAELERFVEEGRLVRVPDSTAFWVHHRLSRRSALLTPDAVALLEEIGRRFHASLAEHGLPPLRLELNSALRSAADQAALRRTNPNAAAGTSTHEFGTTVDIHYAGYSAPIEAATAGDTVDADSAVARLSRAVRAIALEAAAARKSRELTAILGEVLRELQSEGAVMVTLERQQPVYHITLARPLAAD